MPASSQPIRVLIGAPVRRSPEIFKHYLTSLRNLNIPEINGRHVKVDKHFILHNSPELAGFIDPAFNEQYTLHASTDDFCADETTHHWSSANIEQVVAMKNGLLDYAVKNGYDYFFLVDSDLVLHPDTLVNLLNHAVQGNKDLISNIFWTRWQPDQPELPNAWDFDNYTFLEGTVEKWRQPGCYKVGMTGACFLISRRAIAAGVSYARVPNLSYMIFWGEDRHFCVRAACLGFDIWMDTFYPATHLYRDSDLKNLK